MAKNEFRDQILRKISDRFRYGKPIFALKLASEIDKIDFFS